MTNMQLKKAYGYIKKNKEALSQIGHKNAFKSFEFNTDIVKYIATLELIDPLKLTVFD